MKYTALITYFNSPNPADAILSVLNQSIKPGEIIVVDDCSEVDYQLMLREAAARYGCIYLRTNTNIGPAGARNHGVRHSNYDTIIIFDDDDISLPDRAKVHIQELLKGCHLSYVSSRKIYSNRYSTEAINEIYFGNIDPLDFCKYLLSGDDSERISKKYVPACTLAFNKSMFDQETPFDSDFRRLEDVDFALRASKQNLIFSFSNVIGVDRKSSEGIDKTSQLEYEAQLKILSKHHDLLGDDNYRKMVMWSDLRSLYFSKKYLKVLSLGIRFFLKFGVDFAKLRNGYVRIIHDLRKDS